MGLQSELFRMWCTATCRQRINAMVLTVPDTTPRTSEDECKWYYHQMMSELNWRSPAPPGGPGPPTPRVASFPTGSAHTPHSGFGTLTPYDLFSWDKGDIRLLQYYYAWFILITSLHLEKNSLCSCRSSSSRLTRPFLFFLLDVAPALAEHWLLIILVSWRGWALPHTPPPSWPHFPRVPGHALLPCWAQEFMIFSLLNGFTIQSCDFFFTSSWI